MLGNGVCEAECYTALCDFDHADCVHSTHPLSVFVSPAAAAPFLGTTVFPYQSLYQALSTVSAKYLNIYLLAGVHTLDSTQNYDLLAKSSALGITISSAQAPAVLQLTPFPAYFNVTMPLTVSNVRIQGGFSLKPDCFSSTCTYCPALTQDLLTGQWQNDRNQYINPSNYAEKSLCDAYLSYVLFSVQSEVPFSLVNVTFANIQHQPLALVQSQCGLISLHNVTFTNITVQSLGLRSGVIQWVRLKGREPYYCGSFSYETGTVELLNNGYEFNAQSNFSGFAYFSAIKLVFLSNVQFLYNNMFTGLEVSASSSSLIFIEEMRETHISKCTFKGNVADVGGAIYINSAVTIPIESQNGISKEHNLVHVWIENSVFEGNSARIGAAVHISFTDEHQNVWVDNCSFVGNVAWEREVLGVSSPFVTGNMAVGRTETILQGGLIVTVRIPPAYVKFTNLRIEGNIAPYFTYNQHIGVYQISNTSFTGNGELSGTTVNPVLAAFINHPSSYVSLSVETGIFITCQNMVFIDTALDVSIRFLDFFSGYCPSGSSGITVSQGLEKVTTR